MRRLVHKLNCKNQQVRFASKQTVSIFYKRDDATTITYDSGVDHHYMSEADMISLGLPILRASKKQVVVANGSTSRGSM